MLLITTEKNYALIRITGHLTLNSLFNFENLISSIVICWLDEFHFVGLFALKIVLFL